MSRASAISPAIYLGEDTIEGNDASQNATIPEGTQTIWITAEGGLARATVNGVATANSGTYAPDGTPRLIGRDDEPIPA